MELYRRGKGKAQAADDAESPLPPTHSFYGRGSSFSSSTSRNHGGGGSYHHYGEGYSGGYVNERSSYTLPPRADYYVPAPQPPLPAYTHPQQPWLPEQYVPPPPVFYQSEPPQPPPPYPPSNHFFEPPPRPHQSTGDQSQVCIIM